MQLTVQLPEKIVQRLWDDIDDNAELQVTVDLPEREVRWAGQVHGMAVRAFGPGPDAGDITQQTFLSAWTGRAGSARSPWRARCG